MTVVAILARQVTEALECLHRTAVEVDPVGIVGHRDAVHRVPEGAGVAVGHMFSVALTALHRTGKLHHDRNGIDAVEALLVVEA